MKSSLQKLNDSYYDLVNRYGISVTNMIFLSRILSHFVFTFDHCIVCLSDYSFLWNLQSFLCTFCSPLYGSFDCPHPGPLNCSIPSTGSRGKDYVFNMFNDYTLFITSTCCCGTYTSKYKINLNEIGKYMFYKQTLENTKGRNQKWTFQRNRRHRVHKTKKNKTKTQHILYWTPTYTQTNTNKVNKTWVLLQ